MSRDNYALYDLARERFVPAVTQDAVDLHLFRRIPVTGTREQIVHVLAGFQALYPLDAERMRIIHIGALSAPEPR